MSEQEPIKVELAGECLKQANQKMSEPTKKKDCLKSFDPPQTERLEKVAIMGFAPSWVHMPFTDPTFEFWTLNEAYKLLQNKNDAIIHRWFELHNHESPSKKTKEHMEFLKNCPCPLYIRDKTADIPNGIPFPFQEILSWFKDRGHIGFDYQTNSISWMIAFAVMQGFKEIHVYGVDMAQDASINGTSEYAYQKPSCEYWLGVAEKYAKVYVPEDSDLLKCSNLYGLESDNTTCVWLKKQITELDKRGKHFNLQEQQAKQATFNAQIAQAELRGATSAYRQLLKKRI